LVSEAVIQLNSTLLLPAVAVKEVNNTTVSGLEILLIADDVL